MPELQMTERRAAVVLDEIRDLLDKEYEAPLVEATQETQENTTEAVQAAVTDVVQNVVSAIRSIGKTPNIPKLVLVESLLEVLRNSADEVRKLVESDEPDVDPSVVENIVSICRLARVCVSDEVEQEGENE